MRKKTMFLGMLGAGLMWMPTSAILAAQMNNAAMSVQQNQGIKYSGGYHWRNLDWCKREGGWYNKRCRYRSGW